ncbi:transglutaminase-like cysteine peptidase [Salinarimonas soli]|uniref:Transglutaminase-like cysteine peptidase n=1 Tax=Salinarimonas soli TaxID=1638099 RepID=A0A5B2VDB9_9HYPH|nr:transglutaminase-like cysteine peptidase [Salinarimonas soli]KAA2236765.1 transglutaminase-like cysteine peptidase [Salinarimonas soli]
MRLTFRRLRHRSAPSLGLLAAATAVLLPLTSPALAGAGSAGVSATPWSLTPSGRPAKPAPGWTRFCARFPGECAAGATDAKQVSLTPRTWATLVGINHDVNARIKAKTDREHWGVGESWDLAEDGYGDCEDFQLVKRRKLVAAGFPRRALRMTVVLDGAKAGHAVLMVRTDRGDLILDNTTDAVLPWHETRYTFVKREADTETGWTWIGVASPSVARR